MGGYKMKTYSGIGLVLTALIVMGGYAKAADEPFVINTVPAYSHSNHHPDISGTNVVWYGIDGDYEIFLYNGTEVENITDNDSDDRYPVVSGSNIAWLGRDSNNRWQIFLYDGATISQISNNPPSAFGDTVLPSPDISGTNIVWSGYDPDGDDFEIFLYNGTEIVQITDNDSEDRQPVVSGTNVAWSGWDGNDFEIFLYNGTEIVQITDNDSHDEDLNIDGSRIVWEGAGTSWTEIFLYDGVTTTQITNNSLQDNGPAISGSYIVWMRAFSTQVNDYEIFFYDGTTEYRVTNNNVPDGGRRAISGASFVWESGGILLGTFHPPQSCSAGQSSDPSGNSKTTYNTSEIVYASGSCSPPSSDIDVYIVGDYSWSAGMAIPPDLSDDGMNTLQTDGSGNLGPVAVWQPPLTVGEYDMVFDANQNGTYDAGIDTVDNPNHPGFTVTTTGGGGAVGGTASMANKVELLAPWIVLTALVLLSAGIIIGKFKKQS
jgi:hypothetical protein